MTAGVASNSHTKYLLLRTDGKTCAIELGHVAEAMRPQPLRAMSGMPDGVLGEATPRPVSRFVLVKAGSRIEGMAAGAQEYAGKPYDRRYLASIGRGAQRMQGLIDDLLTCARVSTTALDRSAVSLAAVVEQVMANLQAAVQQSGARVETADLPEVQADATQLLQLLQNLVRNAITYRQEGSSPTIRIRAEDRDREWLASVEDDGIGIAPEHRERIFGIFRRLHPRMKYPGNGIGLAVCKDVVEKHGGRIWVESEPGVGSSFFFTLAKCNEVPEPQAKGGPA